VSEYACPTEDALDDGARRRAHEIAIGEEAASRAMADDEQGHTAEEEIAQVHSSGRQHDLTDTAAYQRSRNPRRIRGPRR
jgi:hypothetical protein